MQINAELINREENKKKNKCKIENEEQKLIDTPIDAIIQCNATPTHKFN